MLEYLRKKGAGKMSKIKRERKMLETLRKKGTGKMMRGRNERRNVSQPWKRGGKFKESKYGR